MSRSHTESVDNSASASSSSEDEYESDDANRFIDDEALEEESDAQSDGESDSHESHSSIDPESAFRFNSLPPELRLKIWQYFCPELVSKSWMFQFQAVTQRRGPRHAEIWEAGSLAGDTERIRTVLSVDRDSRSWALKRFPDSLGIRGGRGAVRFNKEVDVVHLEIVINYRIDSLPSEFCQDVRYLSTNQILFDPMGFGPRRTADKIAPNTFLRLFTFFPHLKVWFRYLEAPEYRPSRLRWIRDGNVHAVHQVIKEDNPIYAEYHQRMYFYPDLQHQRQYAMLNIPAKIHPRDTIPRRITKLPVTFEPPGVEVGWTDTESYDGKNPDVVPHDQIERISKIETWPLYYFRYNDFEPRPCLAEELIDPLGDDDEPDELPRFDDDTEPSVYWTSDHFEDDIDEYEDSGLDDGPLEESELDELERIMEALDERDYSSDDPDPHGHLGVLGNPLESIPFSPAVTDGSHNQGAQFSSLEPSEREGEAEEEEDDDDDEEARPARTSRRRVVVDSEDEEGQDGDEDEDDAPTTASRGGRGRTIVEDDEDDDDNGHDNDNEKGGPSRNDTGESDAEESEGSTETDYDADEDEEPAPPRRATLAQRFGYRNTLRLTPSSHSEDDGNSNGVDDDDASDLDDDGDSERGNPFFDDVAEEEEEDDDDEEDD